MPARTRTFPRADHRRAAFASTAVAAAVLAIVAGSRASAIAAVPPATAPTINAAPAVAPRAVDEQRSTLADQRGVAVTIYNENLALVKDTRRIDLVSGASRLALRDVSAQMRPETALLRAPGDPGAFDVFEQNFDFDLLTPAKLLEKSVGRKVRIVKTNPTTGAETVETAEVLATSGGPVLRVGDRIETGIPGRIVFDEVPASLRDRPTLVTQLSVRHAGPQTVELSYLTGGLGWRADYVAELAADDAALDLKGWVTLTNQSGTTYTDARLQLVAGDVNRVRQEMSFAKRAADSVAAPAPVAANGMVQENLFEYHLYTLGRTTTIADNQSKQVALLAASSVPVTKELLISGSDYYYRSSVGQIGQKLKAGVFVEFENRESAHMGMPLPKGVVRVYKRDASGAAQFVGEDRIDHTGKNEKVRLRLGDAFDVVADKKQTDFRRRESTNNASYVFESAYELVVRNAKREPVTVTVREPVPGDWTMLGESAPHEKVASGTAEWKLVVPAEGSTTLKYRVLVRV